MDERVLNLSSREDIRSFFEGVIIPSIQFDMLIHDKTISDEYGKLIKWYREFLFKKGLYDLLWRLPKFKG